MKHGEGRGIYGCHCKPCHAAYVRYKRRKQKPTRKEATWELWNCTPTREELLALRSS